MLKKFHISPWMTIGTSLFLMVVVAFLGIVNYNRDKERMGTLLKEKGAALIRSFEAGARTGMMGVMGHNGLFANEIHLQILLEETAGQPDISYISIVDKAGMIQAHNDRRLVGTRFITQKELASLSLSDEPEWRLVEHENGETYFEVFKTFLPIMEHFGHIHKHWETGNTSKRILNPSLRPYIFIGMNTVHFQEAMSKDYHHNIVMAAIILALGIAGVVSLFWAHNYTRSQRLLLDARKFASEVVTNLPVGIIVVDPQYRILYSNDLAGALLRKPDALVKGRRSKELIPDSIWGLHDRVLSGLIVAEKEVTLHNESGKNVPVAVSATHIRGEDGSVSGSMFVLKDLTEIRELELKSQRIEKLATIGNLAAGIAHEVRNPLSSIKGYVTYFGTLFEDGSDNRKAADLMAEEVDRVNRVISELLEFARPSDLRFTEFNIEDLIDQSIRVVRHEAGIAGVEISKRIDPDLPALNADIDRMTQVMLNLYINAIQAMKDGGLLSVSVRKTKAAMMIKVEDTGNGISGKALKQIFDPYFTTKNNGTGLGLAIAHKIIENHNGTIEVASREGIGTSIAISLPINNGKEDAA